MSATIPRWRTGLTVAVVASLLAVALGVPALFFLAIVALGFVLVGTASAGPTAEIHLERSIDDDRPRPGQSVTVTVSLTNEGEGVATDVRVVDDPPSGVAITAGSPAHATAIRPGETVGYQYELTPPRGEYTFGSPTIRLRNLAATARERTTVEPAGDTALTCETLFDSFPVRDRTIRFVGRTPTDDGGSGVEFYATREYRRGDPINRIDWHRFARTGTLATVEYREERAVTVVFVIDDRPQIHREPIDGGPDSFDLSLYAGSRGVVASLDDGNRTGFVMLTGEHWVEPGAGEDVRQRVETAIEDERSARDPVGRRSDTAHGRSSQSNSMVPGSSSAVSNSAGSRSAGSNSTSTRSGSNTLSDGGKLGHELGRDLERRLPRNAQVVFCTPLTDRVGTDVVRTLRSHDRAVTVVSPNLTTGVSAESVPSGARITGLERRNRIDELRRLGATVVDWNLADPLPVDLARALPPGRASR